MILILLGSLSFISADTDGPWSILSYKGYAGELTINPLTGTSLFYQLFQKIDGDIVTDYAPLILWLDGGPGCSGQYSMVYGLVGPYTIDQNHQPKDNPLTWTTDYHVLQVDFPLSTGYSYATTYKDYKNTTMQAVDYLYDFCKLLMAKYPTWFNRDIYIFGHSYAGHWIPGIGYKIITQNISQNQTVFRLRGIGIGNPYVSGQIQNKYFARLAFSAGVIGEAQKENIQTIQDGFNSYANASNYIEAVKAFNSMENKIYEWGGVKFDNLRKYTNEVDYYTKFFNENSTKTLLHVPEQRIWSECSNIVQEGFLYDQFSSTSSQLAYLLDYIKVVIFSGQDDMLVSSISTQEMLKQLQWSKIEQFLSARRAVYKLQDQVVGYTQFYDNLRYIEVLKSGHIVILDQPKVSRDLLMRFIEDYPFDQQQSVLFMEKLKNIKGLKQMRSNLGFKKNSIYLFNHPIKNNKHI